MKETCYSEKPDDRTSVSSGNEYAQLTDLVWQKGSDGKYIWCNPGFAASVKTEAGQINGKTDYDLYPEKIAAIYREEDLRVIASGQPIYIEEYTPDGNSGCWWKTRKMPVYDTKGQVIGTIGITSNITLERKAIDELRAEEAKYRAFFESSLDAIMLTSPDGMIYAANPKACEMFGCSEREIIAAGRAGLTYPDDPNLNLLFKQRAETGKAFGELTFSRHDGSRFTGEVTSALFKDAKGEVRTSMIIRDITNRLATEKRLAESEQQLINLINNMPGFAYRCLNDREWTMLYLSSRFAEVTGFEIQDVVHNSVLSYNEIIHPADRDYLYQAWQKAIADDSWFEDEYRIVNASGEIRWVWERGKAIRANDGTIEFIDGFITDITSRRTIQDELEAYRNSLEEQVRLRTAELEEKNRELERMNKLFVGREFRIKQLKETIYELQNQLNL